MNISSEIYPWDNLRHKLDIDPSLCVVLSPFKSEFAGPRQVIEDVAREFNRQCIRLDDVNRPGIIHADIWEYIQKAAIIVADITDANPNVMLELGVACAIKEKFRVILMIRTDAVASVPFDLGPFRHIRYEDTLAGSGALRQQLREYFKLALNEENVLSSLVARMEEWDRSDRHYALLVSPDSLARLRGFGSIQQAPPQVLAYLLSAAIQHGADVSWWAPLNRSNPFAAEAAVELLLGPWACPQVRAAFALQEMAPELRESAVQEARQLSSVPFVHRLLDAVLQGTLVEYITREDSGMLNESQRYELLQNFTPRMRVRLSRVVPSATEPPKR